MDSMHPTHIQGFPPAAGLHVPAWVPPCPTCMAMCPLALITSMPTCTFSHGCHLDPPTWMHSPSPSLHLCPPAFPHTDMSCPPHGCPPPHDHHTFCPNILHGCPSSHPHRHMPTHTHCIHHIHMHLHVPTQICLIPLHGCPPPHTCLTHCLPACPPMGSPSSTVCLLVLISSMPTCMSLHRYVSSHHMETCPLLIVAPAIHTSCLHRFPPLKLVLHPCCP